MGQLFWKGCCGYVATTLKQFLPEDPEVPFPRCPFPSDVLCHPNGRTGLSADTASSSMQNSLCQPSFILDPRKPAHNLIRATITVSMATIKPWFSPVLQCMGNSAPPGDLTHGCSAPKRSFFHGDFPMDS